MSTRLRIPKVQPEAYKAMDALDSYLDTTQINPLYKELIKIRASQINGCAYCMNSHTQDALKKGEKANRLFVLSGWREATNWFSEEEQAILAFTEEVTLISNDGVSDEVYNKMISLFGEAVTAQVLMAIITINAWNRIGVSLHMQPK
jgi:AhpD family alkylhydroperoxidase